MKKLLFIGVSVFYLNTLYAQNFGVQAGVTFYSAKATSNNVSLTADTKTGFTVGVTSSWPLGSNFSFMPALNFTQKGGSWRVPGGAPDEKLNDSYNYLDLPLDFVYNTNGKTGRFFAGAGPAIGFGIGGKEHSTVRGIPDSDIHFGNGANSDLKPFELSANIIAGYQWNNGFFVSANYNPGISDLAIGNDSDAKFHNNGFGIRIGYMFGGMKMKSSSDNK